MEASIEILLGWINELSPNQTILLVPILTGLVTIVINYGTIIWSKLKNSGVTTLIWLLFPVILFLESLKVLLPKEMLIFIGSVDISFQPLQCGDEVEESLEVSFEPIETHEEPSVVL